MEETVDGVLIADGYLTYTDERGNLVQLQFTRREDGTFSSTPILLTGANFGEQVGQLITPFLTAALLDDDASMFEEIATNTILGTFVENIFEYAGGSIHDQIASGGLQNAGAIPIAEYTFEDIFTDLGTNAVGYTSQALTSWIMAEVFGGVLGDSVAGDVLNSLLTQGVDYLVDTALHTVLTDVLQVSADWITDFGEEIVHLDQIFSVGNIQSIILNTLFRELLPEIETTEGAIASGLVALALETFDGLLSSITDLFGGLGDFLSGFGSFNPMVFVYIYARRETL